MSTLEKQVKDAIKSAISAQSMEVAGIFENAEYAQRVLPVAAVGVESSSVKSVGMNDYLGCTGADGASEVYGKRMELKCAIDVYAPKDGGMSACEECCEKVRAALCTALPSGLRVREIKNGETEFDRRTGMFRQRIGADFDAYFTAQTDESGLLLDFELRGVIDT